MEIEVVSKRSDQESYILIPLAKDGKLEQNLKRLARRFSIDAEWLLREFTGESKETLESFVRKKGISSKMILIGLGIEDDYSGFLSSLSSYFIGRSKKLEGIITVDLSLHKKSVQSALAQAVVNASITGAYDLGLYKTSKSESSSCDLKIIADDSASDVVGRAQKIALTQNRIRDLVNAPANKLTPEILGDWVKSSGKEYGYEVEVMGQEQIVKNGLNAVLAVNQGSDVPAAFVIAKYRHPQSEKHLGLVGKGVTFDTGGISIKGSANMHYMKSDMGGAAAVLGTIEAVAKLRLPIDLTVIVPAVENSVDARSMKPGDIIHSYSGKTIEVIDTDAEGRLILADALAYLTKNYQTDILIDFATLTGSVIATLGYHAAGMFTNSDYLIKELSSAGDKCGERLWPLPIWKAYEEDLESDVADVKNYSGKPIAGAITAAKFLEVFINDHPQWCHMDIAGMAFADSPLGKQKHATAFGVNLMVNFLEGIAKK